MSAVRGRYIGGKIVLDAPPDWPEGAEVRVEFVGDDVGVGLREKDWPTDPAGIADLLARIDAIEPWMTPEEEAEWKRARAEYRAWELAHWEEHSEKLRRLFE